MKFAIVKTSINPSSPSYLSGQINRIERHTGILDDLYCTAVIIQNNHSKICFLAYDLLQFDDSLSNRIRNSVAEKLGIDKEYIFTIPSHTHAAPEVLKDGLFGIKTESSVSEAYLDFLVDVSVSNSSLANQKLVETVIEYSEVEIDGFYGNRNDKSRVSDKKIRFMLFKNEHRVEGILVNLSCHPTVLGPKNTLISSDLFGVIRKELEERYHCPVFMSNGAEGDMSNRHYRKSDDVDELVRTGNGILNQIPNPIPSRVLSIKYLGVYHKQFDFNCFNDKIRIENAIKRNNQLILESNDKDQLKILHSTNTVLSHQLNKENINHLTIDYSIINLGSLLIVCVPMELFSSLYLNINQETPVILFGLTNTSIGYCVDEQSFDHTYEGLTSIFIKGEGERFIESLNQEIMHIKRKDDSI